MFIITLSKKYKSRDPLLSTNGGNTGTIYFTKLVSELLTVGILVLSNLVVKVALREVYSEVQLPNWSATGRTH